MKKSLLILLLISFLLPVGVHSKSGPPKSRYGGKTKNGPAPYIPGNIKADPENTTTPAPEPVIEQTPLVKEIQTPNEEKPAAKAPAEKKEPKKGNVIIEFSEGSIQELIKYFSELLGKNFTYEDSIKGTVSLIGPGEVSKWEAKKIFESALEQMGYAVIWGWPINKIVPISQAKNGGNVPVY